MILADEYNNRERVPDHPQIIAGWHTHAADFRATAKAEFDISYGAGERNRLDLFQPQGEALGPMVVFIHGGYWRSFDKSLFSHFGAGAVAHGLQVAVPSYSLCPSVTVPDIIDELRQCCLYLNRVYRKPLVVCGHSAGGHLAACMAATDWTQFGADAGLVQAGFAISGVFDLRPLLATPHNDDIRLTPQTALMASPITWPVPRQMAFPCWVGGTESGEFLRQSKGLSAAWTGLGLDAPYHEVPFANHFNVPDELSDPTSAMTRQLVALTGI